jgi:hypothetical protein
MNHKEIINNGEIIKDRFCDDKLKELLDEYFDKKEAKKPLNKVLNKIQDRVNQLLNPPRKKEFEDYQYN